LFKNYDVLREFDLVEFGSKFRIFLLKHKRKEFYLIQVHEVLEDNSLTLWYSEIHSNETKAEKRFLDLTKGLVNIKRFRRYKVMAFAPDNFTRAFAYLVKHKERPEIRIMIFNNRGNLVDVLYFSENEERIAWNVFEKAYLGQYMGDEE